MTTKREIILSIFNMNVSFNLRENFMCGSYDFTCMLLSVYKMLTEQSKRLKQKGTLER